jgi:hypothetical protein
MAQGSEESKEGIWYKEKRNRGKEFVIRKGGTEGRIWHKKRGIEGRNLSLRRED